MAGSSGRQRGDLERDVLATLAGTGDPMTPAQVRTALRGELAYTTVMTTLARLHTKGALTRTLAGRAYTYELAGRPEDAQSSVTAHHMRRLLDSGTDRSGVLTRFVADLSATDSQLLADLVHQMDEES